MKDMWTRSFPSPSQRNQKHCTERSRPMRGFTLVEMMLVITIMAIMLGTVAPNFKPFLEGTTLKNAANTLSHLVRYARSLAVERSASTQLTFDTDTGIILLSVESDPLNFPGIYEPVPLPVSYPKEYRTQIAIAGIVKQSLSGSLEENVVNFLSDGTSSDTLIYLVDRCERTYTVGIVGLTGQVMVWNHAVQTFYE